MALTFSYPDLVISPGCLCRKINSVVKISCVSESLKREAGWMSQQEIKIFSAKQQYSNLLTVQIPGNTRLIFNTLCRVAK